MSEGDPQNQQKLSKCELNDSIVVYFKCIYPFVLMYFRPTELDALVFGHLFSLLTIQLPAVDIAADIKEFVNLTEFCQRIEAKYFKEKEDN